MKYRQEIINLVKRQLKVNADKYLSKKIDAKEFDRRNKIAVNFLIK